MKRTLTALVCMVMLTVPAFGGDDGYKVNYDGGSVSGLKSGNAVQLLIDGNQIELAKGKSVLLTIPASAITEISYGQDVHRRVGTAIGLAVISFGAGAFMLLAKSKKHYVGLTWAVGNTKGGFAMQCNKNDYRGILAGLEGVTGKKAVDSDSMNVKN